MNRFHIACGQFVATPGDKGANVARMLAYARQARERGCALVLFPEWIVTGYLPAEKVAPLVESVKGPSVERIARGAREMGIAIAFGLAEQGEAGACYNSLVVVGSNGELAGVYRKIHLWGAEEAWAVPGTEVVAFDLGGVRGSGWICYDTRFPEVGRLSALTGADVALVSTAWLGPREEWELALRARALDNSFFVAGADIINHRPDLRCVGASLIVGPRGEVLAQAEPGQEGIIDAVLDGAALERQRGRVQLLENRRLDVYG
jgi:predicted amidohydrolase